MTRSIVSLLFLSMGLAASPLSGQVTPDQERRLVRPPPGSLSGLVWDSTRSQPLPGARVVIFGTEFSTETDSEGRFSFQGLPEGMFSVAFNHPRLDTLLAFPPAVEVEIRPQTASEVLLGVPTVGTILAAACIFENNPPDTSPLVGRVQMIPSGDPIPTARVALRRVAEPGSQVRRARGDRLPMLATADAGGRYVLCGVPTDTDLSLQASFFGHQTQPTQVRLDQGTHTTRDLGMVLPPGFLTARTVADIRLEGAGTQGVQGWIREPESAAPVRGATVTLRQTPGTIVVTGETNPRGFFRLQTPLPGTYTLEAEALGYGEISAAELTVELGKLNHLEITMAPAPLELEPLVAVGIPRVFQLEMQGFYDRQERGFGYFLSPDDLERLSPENFHQVFQRVPGVRVSSVNGLGTKLTVLRPSVLDGPECTPRMYIDGAVVGSARLADDSTGVGVDPTQLVSIHDLDAIEFYRGAATVPLVWSTMGRGDCGTILMWTKIGARAAGGT